MTMRHCIRQQTLEIQIDREASALTLQADIDEINRRRFLPLIEQVLDEFAVPGGRIRIERLEVDLGELPFDDFTSAAAAALPPALRSALEQALRDTSEDAADKPIRPETASQLELLEHYLLHGTLPFWECSTTFSVESLLQQLASDDPAGLVALIGHHAQDRRLLERIVLQLDEATLQRLLHLITPEHAALILAYMLDLQRIHRSEPLLSLRDTAFDGLLWILVLNYLLRDAGSQFNRRSFLRWLLESLAESESLDYVQLVETLRRGLQQMKQHQAPTSSLPAALDELLQELRDDGISLDDDAPIAAESTRSRSTTEAADRPRQALEQLVIRVRPPSGSPPISERGIEQRLLHLLEVNPDALRDFIRRHRHDARPIGRLVDGLAEEALIRLLDWLDPEHAALILSYLLDLRGIHRNTPLVVLNKRRFDRLLWVLVLSYVIDNPGSQFNRKSLVLSLLQGMAQSEGLDLADLIETLRLGLAAIEAHLSSATSLPAIIRELAGDVTVPHENGHAPMRAPADAFIEHDRAELFRHILRTGKLPWQALLPDEAGARRHLEQLALLPPFRLRAVFTETPVREPAVVAWHLVQAVPEAALLALAQRLLPAEAEASPLRSSLSRFAGQAAGRRMFYAGIVVALLANEVIDFERLLALASDTDDVVGSHPTDPVSDRLAPAPDAAMLHRIALDFLRGDNARPGAATNRDAQPWRALLDDRLVYAVCRALDDGTEDIGEWVRQHAVDRRQRERWIKLLPAPALARLSHVIEPERHHALLGAAEILVAAWRQAAPHGAGMVSAHAQLWGLLFDFLAAHRGLDRSVEQLVADFLPRTALAGEDFAARLQAQVRELAGAAGDTGLIAALDQAEVKISRAAGARRSAGKAIRQSPPAPANHKRPAKRLNMKTASGPIEDDDRSRSDPIYIDNAGLVQASAFLPHLFQQLDLLGVDDDGRPQLRDRDAVSRAVHLLQYLVDGRTAAPEPFLVLNKILCGVPPATPVARAIALTDDEQRLCDFLLQSMIANWTTLQGTSVEGLRETFLRREGKLQRVDDGWKLRVQRKTLDVLVDQVPWSISVLLAPWMPAPLHVSW